MIVVADTSPLNYLVIVQYTHVLPSLFGRVLIPPAVANELGHPAAPPEVRDFIKSPPEWLEIRRPQASDPSLCCLGDGEIEAISLALELRAELLLTDDLEARQVALMRHIEVAGTLGVLARAASKGLIDLPQTIAELRKTTFRMPRGIVERMLSEVQPNPGSSRRDVTHGQ
ncbi:MAG: DUF3368 domain-containing protein [Phycisphaerae bacterium]|nr:DUF3368 domain-containing protein [Phycisphaerae bacterium]